MKRMSKYFDGEILSAYEDLNKEFEYKKENTKLQQQIIELQEQLHSQPKKIVEKIRKTIKDDLVYPDNRIDCPFDNGYQGEETLCSVLDKVLKEYEN